MISADAIERTIKEWIDLRRQYAMSQRLSIADAIVELDRDYLRWRNLSPAECLDRYRSRRIKTIVKRIMSIIDDLN